MAFGAILEGPDPTNLKPLVEEAMPMLIELMKDESVAVKDTAAWTIGRVCELISEAACNPAYLQPLLEALVQGLTAEPRVASNVCWAFSSLAEAAYEAAEGDSEDTPPTYCLSAFFDPIVQKLLETTGTKLVFKRNICEKSSLHWPILHLFHALFVQWSFTAKCPRVCSSS